MIVIEVISKAKTRHVQTREKSFDMRYQEADLHVPDGRPRPTEVRPPNNAEYALGLYTLAPQSLTTDTYDRLQLRFITLVPLSEAIDTATAAIKKRK